MSSAQWQRNYLQGAVVEEQLSYWRQQLAGVPAVLELPTDRPRLAGQDFRGALQVFEVGPEVAQGLRQLSQEAGATLFMTLLAAFKVLLYRYTAQDDLVVGTTVANRTRTELEGLIGLFVNTLVLRTKVEGRLSFRKLLERVKEVTLAAYAHQDLPFEKLVEELHPSRSLSHNPMFQVMFSLQTDHIGNLSMNEGKAHGFPTDQTMPALWKLDLSWLITETNAGLTGRIEYNTHLFDDATIAHLKGHFEILLSGIVANPDQVIGELPLLSADERQIILHDWNATSAEYDDTCFHQLFERQAALTPTNTAAVFNDQSISYAELNARSNQLARYIKQADVGPETLVGLCVDRSIDMVVGLLGILKSGAAYLPLDPSYPRARLDFVLKDTRVPVVVTQRKQLTNLPETSARIVLLDADWPAISGELPDNCDTLVSPDNLAYVIYTSGSSGRPKGVMATHRGLANMVAAQIQAFGLTPEDRVLQFSSLSFDVSIWEIALAFGAGSTLCLADQESLLPGTPLLNLIRLQRVTVVVSLPSVLNTLDPDQLPHLKMVNVGGEVGSPETAAHWRKHCRFVNGYGLTETTVCVTYTESFDENRYPPIGRPIANTTTYVLDSNGQPCPVGIAGELYIGGVAVTRGYLNQPALTAERFVPDPFGAIPGRLYRTGDRVRYLADGQIEFLGRIDHQVKVRGYRIELGEIDFILNQHPQVENAVTVIHQDRTGSRLIAYVVPRDAGALDKSELRVYLMRQLPEYMLPSWFVFIERLPLTPNGKIDRKALTVKPDWSAMAAGTRS